MSIMTKHRIDEQVCDCICGGQMVYQTGTVIRVIQGTEIRIHQVPYYECTACGEKSFDITVKIASLAVKAYKSGVHDVVFNSHQANLNRGI